MRGYKEIAHQRMQQILIHSSIYYDFDMNIIEDYQYDSWGNELREIIIKHPNVLEELPYGYMFKDYVSCCSGFNLPYREPRIRSKAQYLLGLRGMI